MQRGGPRRSGSTQPAPVRPGCVGGRTDPCAVRLHPGRHAFPRNPTTGLAGPPERRSSHDSETCIRSSCRPPAANSAPSRQSRSDAIGAVAEGLGRLRQRHRGGARSDHRASQTRHRCGPGGHRHARHPRPGRSATDLAGARPGWPATGLAAANAGRAELRLHCRRLTAARHRRHHSAGGSTRTGYAQAPSPLSGLTAGPGGPAPTGLAAGGEDGALPPWPRRLPCVRKRTDRLSPAGLVWARSCTAPARSGQLGCRLQARFQNKATP